MQNIEEKFTPFYGGVFCQWYPSPMVIDGIKYSCAEQYMMRAKAELFKDRDAAAAIMATSDPSRQKALGRRVKGFNEKAWASVSRDVVMRASLAKFTSSEWLLRALMRTAGTTLVEASPTDVVWGVGLLEDDERVFDRRTWRGTNWLGQVLTDVREAFERAAIYRGRQ